MFGKSFPPCLFAINVTRFPLYLNQHFFNTFFPNQHPPVAVLAKTCSEYDYKWGLMFDRHPVGEFIQFCLEHIAKFAEHMDFPQYLALNNDETMCFRRLVLGAEQYHFSLFPQVGKVTSLQPKFNEYRNKIISGIERKYSSDFIQQLIQGKEDSLVLILYQLEGASNELPRRDEVRKLKERLELKGFNVLQADLDSLAFPDQVFLIQRTKYLIAPTRQVGFRFVLFETWLFSNSQPDDSNRRSRVPTRLPRGQALFYQL